MIPLEDKIRKHYRKVVEYKKNYSVQIYLDTLIMSTLWDYKNLIKTFYAI